MSRTILRIKFGSHLYGTSTPESDLDFKSVFVPDSSSILLHRAPNTLNNHRPKGVGEKNNAGEIDEEQFSIQRFLGLAVEGQTAALDVLFAPEFAMVEPPAWEWQEIAANRHRLLTSKSAALIGYLTQHKLQDRPARRNKIEASFTEYGRTAHRSLLTSK